MLPAFRTSSKAERVREYVATQELPDLTAEEVEEINVAGSKVHHRAFVRALQFINLCRWLKLPPVHLAGKQLSRHPIALCYDEFDVDRGVL